MHRVPFKSVCRISLITLILTASDKLLACFSPPPELYQKPKSLVAKTATIVLAQVTTMIQDNVDEKGWVSYKFETIQVIKGETDKPIEIRGVNEPEHWDTTFMDHEDPEFWSRRGGRLGVDGDCSLAAATFNVGDRYLLFLGGPDDTKCAERINSEDDRWFRFVIDRVSKRTKRTKLPNKRLDDNAG